MPATRIHDYSVAPRLLFPAPPLTPSFFCDVGDPVFDSPRVRPGQPWCWKVTPVYSACQEAYTIYCTLVPKLLPSRSNCRVSRLLPGLTGKQGGFFLDSPVTFIHKRTHDTRRESTSEILGWLQILQIKRQLGLYLLNLRATGLRGQCRRMVQRCGLCGKGDIRSPPFTLKDFSFVPISQ